MTIHRIDFLGSPTSLRSQWPRYLLALLAAALLFAEAASAETVIARRRVGNNTEGITYDSSRDRVIAIDGNDVIAIAFNPLDEAVLATTRNDAGGISGPGYRKIFDINALPENARTPRGLVYVPTQQRFYFSSKQGHPQTTFFATDGQGHPEPPINIQGIANSDDLLAWEGLAWIPPGAPAHAGTIAGLAIRNADSGSHVFFVRLDGTLEAEVVPQPGTPLENYFCGVQFWPQRPGTLLLSNCDVNPGVWAMDMRTGALIGDPTRPLIAHPDHPHQGIEGVVVRRNGQVLLDVYETGRLFSYDSTLHRTPQEDRLFTVGLGTSVNRLGWNFDSQELIAVGFSDHVYALSADLRSALLLFDADINRELPNPNGGVSYLGGNLVAIGARGQNVGIDIAQLDPNLGLGFSVSRLLFDPLGPGLNTVGVGAYGPDQFLVRIRSDGNALKVFSRTGVPDPSVYPDGVIPTRLPDLQLSAPTVGFEAQFFDAGSGPRIFTGTDIYDGSGTLLHSIDVSKLGITDPPLVNGVWIGGNRFATVDGQTSTIILYSVP
jgi:hypothetical protein